MAELWRQKFHLEPPHGWLNDPNALSFFRGKRHFFFQYCPDSAYGTGEKCWGHFESADYVNWQFCGTAISPDTDADRSGAYSGCALCEDGLLRIWYTGNVKYDGDYDYITSGREANVIYTDSADARSFSKKRVLLTNADYPSTCTLHVRDPKVRRISDGYSMVLGARLHGDIGAVLEYVSADGLSWEYRRTVTTPRRFGYMWECPDVITLGGREFLSVSPQGLNHRSDRFQNIYQSGYFPYDAIGEEHFREWDMGFDFYAPQTFTDTDGRVILVGWMGLPDSPYANPTAESGWQHCLSVARELSYDGKSIIQRPVRELDGIFQGKRTVESGGAISLVSKVTLDFEGNFLFRLDNVFELCYNDEKGEVSLAFIGEAGAGRDIRRAHVAKIRSAEILLDTSSAEIYLGGGKTVMSTRFYPQSLALKAEYSGCSIAVSEYKK